MGNLVGHIFENFFERLFRVQVLLVPVGLDSVDDERVGLRSGDDLVRAIQNFESLLQVGELVNKEFCYKTTL